MGVQIQSYGKVRKKSQKNRREHRMGQELHFISIHVFVCLFGWLVVCLFGCLVVCLFIYLSIYLFVCLF